MAPSGPLAPGLYPLAASARAVTVDWYDRSTNEQQFVVYKRDLQGDWQQVYEVPSRNVAEPDGNYSWVDTDTSVSGQCYSAAAVHGDTTAFWWAVGIFVVGFVLAMGILPGRAEPRVPTVRAALARHAIGNCHDFEAADGARQAVTATTSVEGR